MPRLIACLIWLFPVLAMAQARTGPISTKSGSNTYQTSDAWDRVLIDPSCDDIQQAINPYLDEDTPGDATQLRIKAIGKINGDGTLQEVDIDGRHLQGDTDYNICLAIVATNTFTNDFPDGGATTNLGDSIDAPLILDLSELQVRWQSNSHDKPAVFLQLGDGYHVGRSSATTDNWANGAWFRFGNICLPESFEVDSESAHQTQPPGKAWRWPISSWPTRAFVGVFASSISRVNFDCGKRYNFVSDSAYYPSSGWIKTAGWLNVYPPMMVNRAAIGTWWLENTRGVWRDSLVNGGGTGILFGSYHGGSVPVHASCDSTFCAAIDTQEVHGLAMHGVSSNENIAGDWVFIDTDFTSLYGGHTEIGKAWVTSPDHTRGNIMVGAGFCSGGTDAFQNPISGDDSLTDLVCVSDEHCRAMADGSGAETCAVTGMGTAQTEYSIGNLELEFLPLSGMLDFNHFPPLALGPSARAPITGGQIMPGAHLRLRGRIDNVDSDMANRSWGPNFSISDLGTAPCDNVTNNQCWVGDYDPAEPGGDSDCDAGNDIGAVSHAASTTWRLCEYDGAKWSVSSGLSCSKDAKVDCAPYFAHPDADIRVSMEGVGGGLGRFSLIETDFAYDETIMRLPIHDLFHATACNTLPFALRGEVCTQESDNTLHMCEPADGGSVCNATGDWQGPL